MAENKITITPIALRNQKPTDIKECFIELFDTYLHYRVEFFADEPIIDDDPQSGWEAVYNSYNILARKSSISGIEKSFTKDKKWAVYILVSGFAQDIKAYSKSQTAAQELYDRLEAWLFK